MNKDITFTSSLPVELSTKEMINMFDEIFDSQVWNRDSELLTEALSAYHVLVETTGDVDLTDFNVKQSLPRVPDAPIKGFFGNLYLLSEINTLTEYGIIGIPGEKNTSDNMFFSGSIMCWLLASKSKTLQKIKTLHYIISSVCIKIIANLLNPIDADVSPYEDDIIEALKSPPEGVGENFRTNVTCGLSWRNMLDVSARNPNIKQQLETLMRIPARIFDSTDRLLYFVVDSSCDEILSQRKRCTYILPALCQQSHKRDLFAFGTYDFFQMLLYREGYEEPISSLIEKGIK